MGSYESRNSVYDFFFNTEVTMMAHRTAGLALLPAAIEQIKLDDGSRGKHAPDPLGTCRRRPFAAIIAVMDDQGCDADPLKR